MAVTPSKLKSTIDENVNSNVQMATFTALFDASYPTGGESMTFAGFATIDHVCAHPDGAGTYYFVWDYTNGKLMAFTAADGLQVANATDLSTVTARCCVTGRR